MVNTSRHYSIFDPVTWGKRRIDVIGVGATGSRVAMSLAKLGVMNLHVWDDDVVEEHNIANQAYGRNDIDAKKAQAINWAIERAVGMRITVHDHRWESGMPLGAVVFCMVDSMAARRAVFDDVRHRPGVKLVLDSRMGADTGHLFTYSPQDRDSLRLYEQTLYSDDDAITEVSACGTSISVGPTADIIAGLLVWRFIHFAKRIVDPTDETPVAHLEMAFGAGVEPSLVAV